MSYYIIDQNLTNDTNEGKYLIIEQTKGLNVRDRDEDNSQQDTKANVVKKVSKHNKICTKQQQSNQLQLKKKREKILQKCQYRLIKSEVIQKNLSTPKYFMLASGITIELSNSINHYDFDLFVKSMGIPSAQKFNDGSVQVGIQNREALHNFEHIIHILQSSQNQDYYKISLLLNKIQKPVLEIKEQIIGLISIYGKEQLNSLINQRKEYLFNYQQKCMQKFFTDEDFGQILSHTIDWKLKSLYSSKFFITKAMIALLGTTSDGFIYHVMRNNIYWMAGQSSRRKLIDNNVHYLTNDSRNDISYEMEEFEIRMIDNIIIKCRSKVQVIHITYPEELQFNVIGSTDILNRIESLIVIKFEITPQHLEQIMEIRQNLVEDLDSIQLLNYRDKDEYIIDNFEFYMQNQVFIDRFYQDKFIQINTQQQQQQSLLLQQQLQKQQQQIAAKKFRCKYKLILPNQI